MDELAYFRGWKDASDDAANFITSLADNLPSEVSFFAEQFKVIAEGIRSKGNLALATAEAATGVSH